MVRVPRAGHQPSGQIAEALFGVIREGTYDLDRLREFITPESIATWGDFSGYTEIFRSIPNPAIGACPNPASGAPDVVYVKVIPNVTEPEVISGPTLMEVAGVFTFVYRPELGGWKMHAFGDHVLPEDLVRPAPSESPL